VEQPLRQFYPEEELLSLVLLGDQLLVDSSPAYETL